MKENETKEAAGKEAPAPRAKKKLAVVADIHVKETDHGQWTAYFKNVSQKADVLAICGDITNTGRISEAEVLCSELKACSIPVVAVLGNHDYEHNHQEDIQRTLAEAGVHMLDGDFIILEDIGLAGIKGFGGGFDRRMLSMFGEQETKDFVQTAVEEELKLETALSRLYSEHPDLPRVALMHYSPISATVVGEAEQIFPFLGCSRLAEPLDKQKVTAAFHGHAHVGTLQGQTVQGIPVYNVALPLLKRDGIEDGFFLLEV